MKQIITLTCTWFLSLVVTAQIGIGTTTPQATLDINGTLKISSAPNTQPVKGIMRWNEINQDFEGFNGTAWVSLTGRSGLWGNKVHYVHEESATSHVLQFNSQGTSVGKYLGASLSLMNQYLLAGAPGDFNITGTVANAGSVRIFKKEQAGWRVDKAIWSPESTAIAGEFGSSIHSMGTQFIVGARLATVGNNFGQGKAYIYGMNYNGDVILQGQLTSPTGMTSEYLGSSVALSTMHAIAGAPGYNASGQVNRGIAHIFQRNTYTNTWSHQVAVHPPDGLEEDSFGGAVAISGTIAAVASPRAKNGTLFLAGKVYIFRLVNNVWTYSQTITPPSPIAFDKFGTALCMQGDTLVIGSPQYNGSQLSNYGKVYVYVNANNTMSLLATLSASGGNKTDAFGNSVHFQNGLLIAGAPYANKGASESQGKAYIFKRNGNDWIQQAVLTASNGKENDRFGQAVVIGTAGAAVSSLFANYQTYVAHGRIYFYDE